MNGPDRSSPRSRWWWILAAVAVAVALVATVVVLQLPSDTAEPSTSASLPTPVLTTTAASAAKSTTTTPVPAVGYQLLWPFADEQDAAAWQASYRTGGHEPWHLDAGMTAQSFTQGYLGYTTLNQVTTVTQIGAEAHVGVGYQLPTGQKNAAAVLHLIKVGTGQDAPWEVVGTDDTPQLTLTTPTYGATVASPVTVGGRITGVDESLRIQVRRLGDEKAVGQAGGIPAGGDNTAWTASVSFTAPPGSTLTIAVSTGGHGNDVERFAITGVRAGSAASG
jgi:hypothetical protein